MARQLNNPAVPALPVSPEMYNRPWSASLLNVLRLYFNQLKALLDNFVSLADQFQNGDYGYTIKFPHFSGYQDGETQLTADIPNATSTADIHVTSAAHFLSAGYLIIDQEIIQYTGKTATTFTGITRGVLGTTSGKSAHLTGVYVTEAAAVTVGSAYPMIIDVITLSNEITCTPFDSKIYFTHAGIYDIQFSVQLLNYTGYIDDVRIWLVKNGTIVPFSAGIIEVPAQHATTPGAVIAGWNYVEQFSAGEYFELNWRSVTGQTVIATFPQGTSPTRPTSPGLIITVSFVSAIP